MENSSDSDRTNSDPPDVIPEARRRFYSEEQSDKSIIVDDDTRSDDETVIVSETSVDTTTSISGGSSSMSAILGVSERKAEVSIISESNSSTSFSNSKTVDVYHAVSREVCLSEENVEICRRDPGNEENPVDNLEQEGCSIDIDEPLIKQEDDQIVCQNDDRDVSISNSNLTMEQGITADHDTSDTDSNILETDESIYTMGQEKRSTKHKATHGSRIGNCSLNAHVVISSDEISDDSDVVELISSDDDVEEVTMETNTKRTTCSSKQTARKSSTHKFYRRDNLGKYVKDVGQCEQDNITYSHSLGMDYLDSYEPIYELPDYMNTLGSDAITTMNTHTDNEKNISQCSNFSSVSPFNCSDDSLSEMHSKQRRSYHCQDSNNSSNNNNNSNNNINCTPYRHAGYTVAISNDMCHTHLSDNGNHIRSLREKSGKGCSRDSPIDLDTYHATEELAATATTTTTTTTPSITTTIDSVCRDGESPTCSEMISGECDTKESNTGDQEKEGGICTSAEESNDQNIKTLVELMEDKVCEDHDLADKCGTVTKTRSGIIEDVIEKSNIEDLVQGGCDTVEENHDENIEALVELMEDKVCENLNNAANKYGTVIRTISVVIDDVTEENNSKSSMQEGSDEFENVNLLIDVINKGEDNLSVPSCKVSNETSLSAEESSVSAEESSVSDEKCLLETSQSTNEKTLKSLFSPTLNTDSLCDVDLGTKSTVVSCSKEEIVTDPIVAASTCSEENSLHSAVMLNNSTPLSYAASSTCKVTRDQCKLPLSTDESTVKSSSSSGTCPNDASEKSNYCIEACISEPEVITDLTDSHMSASGTYNTSSSNEIVSQADVSTSKEQEEAVDLVGTDSNSKQTVVIGPQAFPEWIVKAADSKDLSKPHDCLEDEHGPKLTHMDFSNSLPIDGQAYGNNKQKRKKRKKRKDIASKGMFMFLNDLNKLECPSKISCTVNISEGGSVDMCTKETSDSASKENVTDDPKLIVNPIVEDNVAVVSMQENTFVEVRQHQREVDNNSGASNSEIPESAEGPAVHLKLRDQMDDNMRSFQESIEEACQYTTIEHPKEVGASYKEFHSKRENHLRGCLWSPDGSCVLTNSDDNILRLFKIPDDIIDKSMTDEMYAERRMCEGETVYDMDWYPYMDSQTPDTCCFLSTSRDHPIHLWDSVNGVVRCSYRAFDQMDELTSAHCVAFNMHGDKIYSGFDKCVRIFDSSRPGNECEERSTVAKKGVKKKGKVKGMQNQSGIISSIAFSGYCGMYALGSFAKTVGLYSANDGQASCLLRGHSGGVTQVKFTTDGYYLISGARKDSEMIWWDLRNTSIPLFKLLRNVSTNQRIQFDIDKLNLHVFSGSTDNMVNIWDLQRLPGEVDDTVISYEPTTKFCAHNDAVNAVCLHPSKPLMASTSGQRHFFEDSDSDLTSENPSEITVFDNSLKIWRL